MLSLAWLVIRLKSLVVLLLVAGLIAAALDGPVTSLQRRLGRRGLAVAVVVLATLVVLVGVGFVVVRPVAQQGQTFRDRMPAAAERLKELPIVGPKLHDTDLRGSTERFLHDLPKRVRGQSKILLGFAQTAVTAGGLALTALVAAVFLLLNGPSLTQSAQDQILDDHRRERARRLGRDALAAVGGYVRGNLFISFVAAMVVVVSLEAMRVPFVPVLAVIMFVLDLVPLIGAALAGVIVTLATFLLDAHPWKALVFVVVFIVYQEIESHTLYPVVMGRTVKIGAISVFFATLAGAELAGILGALLAIPVAAVLNIVGQDILAERRTRAGDAAPQGTQE
ncbi:MAG: AI-2E family transporter [Actinomycetota bacterium]|nr:AI-2E family transporter [Actinomycetota bacterium]